MVLKFFPRIRVTRLSFGMVILKKIQESWILSLLAPTNFGGLGNPRIWDWASRGSLGVWGKAGSGRLASFAGGALGELRASWRMAWRSGAASVTVPRNEVE